MIAMSDTISSEIDRERNEVIQQDGSLAVLVLVIPALIVVKNVSPTLSCHEEWSWKSYPKLYIVSLFALQYVFLLTVISVSHVRIGILIYVSRSNLACSRLSVLGDERKRARKKEGGLRRGAAEALSPFLPRLSPPLFFLSLSLFFAPNYREPGTG